MPRAYPLYQRSNAHLGLKRAGTLGTAPTKNETALGNNGNDLLFGESGANNTINLGFDGAKLKEVVMN